MGNSGCQQYRLCVVRRVNERLWNASTTLSREQLATTQEHNLPMMVEAQTAVLVPAVVKDLKK